MQPANKTQIRFISLDERGQRVAGVVEFSSMDRCTKCLDVYLRRENVFNVWEGMPRTKLPAAHAFASCRVCRLRTIPPAHDLLLLFWGRRGAYLSLSVRSNLPAKQMRSTSKW